MRSDIYRALGAVMYILAYLNTLRAGALFIVRYYGRSVNSSLSFLFADESRKAVLLRKPRT